MTQENTTDTVEIVRHRLADGRTIADADVHRLVAEIDRLRAEIVRMVDNTRRQDCTADTLLIGCRMIGEKALRHD